MELLAGLVLIAAVGFFAGSETAVYRANWIRLTNWLRRNLSGAKLALDLLDRRDSTVVATLVGTNLSVVFATELFSRFFEHHFGPGFAAVAIVLIVILTLILGEYLPKAIAQAFPDRWLRRTALPLAVSRIAFAPAVFLLGGITRLIAGPPPSDDHRFRLTRQDLLAAMTQRDRGAGPDPHTSRMVARLFRFSRIRVCEIEIPIEEVKSVPHDAGLNDILALINRYGFSRMPVYDGDATNLTGVIVAKDMLAAPAYRLRRLPRVAGSTRAMEVLRTMQHRGEHIAAVEDDEHHVTGIVSLEDLLEELVGEIRSED